MAVIVPSSAPPTRKPRAKITDIKSAEEILNPTPLEFKFKGHTFEILPVPDAVLQTITDNISACIAVILGAPEADTDGEVPGVSSTGIGAFTKSLGRLSPADITKFIPQIIEVLLPNSTLIIASALAASSLDMLGNETVDFSTYRRRARVSADWVDDNLFRSHRLEALEVILRSEDIPAIVSRFETLVAMEWATAPAKTEAPIG